MHPFSVYLILQQYAFSLFLGSGHVYSFEITVFHTLLMSFQLLEHAVIHGCIRFVVGLLYLQEVPGSISDNCIVLLPVSSAQRCGISYVFGIRNM